MGDEFDPMGIWQRFNDAPNEDEQHDGAPAGGWEETRDEEGNLTITVTPTLQARASAATLAGFFIALQDAGFTRDEAFTVVQTSISDVVVVGGHDDE